MRQLYFISMSGFMAEGSWLQELLLHWNFSEITSTALFDLTLSIEGPSLKFAITTYPSSCRQILRSANSIDPKILIRKKFQIKPNSRTYLYKCWIVELYKIPPNLQAQTIHPHKRGKSETTVIMVAPYFHMIWKTHIILFIRLLLFPSLEISCTNAWSKIL